MQEKYKKLIRLSVIVGVVYLGFRFLLPLFLPFLAAYFIAWLLRRPVSFLHRKLHIKPVVGGAILVLLLLAVAGSGLVFGIRILLVQFADLAGNYETYFEGWNGYLEGICRYCDGVFRMERGSTFLFLNDCLDGLILFFQEELLPFVTRNSLKAAVSVTELAAALVVTFVAVLLFLSEKEQKRKEPSFLAAEWKEVKKELSGAGTAYIKTQVILILLVSMTCSIGFFIVGSQYALLFGVGVGLLDALPIFGSVMVLVPWAIICFVKGAWFDGAVLLTLYGICQFFREYLEPKLLGDKMGFSPVKSLMAVYVGYELFGFLGLFLGPIGLVLIKSLWRVG